jgi:hypothetical protein
MERNRCLKFWFVRARRSHDIHHWALNDQGLMDKNFGIGFFFFDRLFGTHTREQRGFNRRGYRAALRRFGDLVGTEDGRISDCDDGEACEDRIDSEGSHTRMPDPAPGAPNRINSHPMPNAVPF